MIIKHIFLRILLTNIIKDVIIGEAITNNSSEDLQPQL